MGRITVLSLIVLLSLSLETALVSAGAILVDVRVLNQTGEDSYVPKIFLNETAAGQYSYTLLVMNVTAKDLGDGYFSVGIRGLVIDEFPSTLNLTGRWINMTFKVKSKTNTFVLDGQGAFFPLYIVFPESKTLFHLGEQLQVKDNVLQMLQPPSNRTVKLVGKYVKVYTKPIEVNSVDVRSRKYFNYTICNVLPPELQRKLNMTKGSSCFLQRTPYLDGSFLGHKPLSIMALYPRDPFGVSSGPVILSVDYIPTSPDELKGQETPNNRDLLKPIGIGAIIVAAAGVALTRRGGR
ncbi:hypothetical protein [Thermococcus gammatolerans]|nr:hypothetical protein [Thermococcus gammatolerans]